MGEAAKPPLAQRIDAIIREAVVDVVQDARDEGWRAGYAAGRLDVRREMNDRLRALILEEDGTTSVPQATDAAAAETNGTSLADIFDRMFGQLSKRAAPRASTPAPVPASDPQPTADNAAEDGEKTEKYPAAPTCESAQPHAPAQDGAEVRDHVRAELGLPPLPAITETAAAIPAAAPAGPGAEPALNQAPPLPQPAPAPAPAPVPQTFATPPAPGAQRPVWPSDWRTEDRKKVFIEMYERGDDMTVIRLALGDIPGPRMPDKNQPLWGWVTGLKLRRKATDGAATSEPEPEDPGQPPSPPPAAPLASPPTAEPARVRPPAIHPSIAPPGPRPEGTNPKAQVIDLPPPAANGKVYTTFYNIRAWAGVYGIAYDGSNLERVNKLRVAKSLPLLVQEGS